MNDFFDFTVTNVNTIIERDGVKEWAVSNLTFSDNYVMVICLSGKAYYTLPDNTNLTARKNRVLLFPPCNIRSGNSDHDDPWHFISVNFNLNYINGNENDLSEAVSLYVDNVSESVRQKFITLSSIWKKKEYMYKLKCRILIQDILFDIINLGKTSKYLYGHYNEIEKTVSYLRENFTKKISSYELTKIHNLSETHFRKLFRESMGMSVKEYIIKIRLEYAKDLINSGEFNITEAAAACGISDVYYFSSLFKKKYGYSPSKIKKFK